MAMDLRDKVKFQQGGSSAGFVTDESTGVRHLWIGEVVLTSPIKDVEYVPEEKADRVTTVSGSQYIVPACLTHYRVSPARLDEMRSDIIAKSVRQEPSSWFDW